MRKDNIESLSGQNLFVGIDAHKKSFHVTLRTFDCELSSQSISASWSAWQTLLNPFKAFDIKAIYHPQDLEAAIKRIVHVSVETYTSSMPYPSSTSPMSMYS